VLAATGKLAQANASTRQSTEPAFGRGEYDAAAGFRLVRALPEAELGRNLEAIKDLQPSTSARPWANPCWRLQGDHPVDTILEQLLVANRLSSGGAEPPPSRKGGRVA
jgi:hypothetical protein